MKITFLTCDLRAKRKIQCFFADFTAVKKPEIIASFPSNKVGFFRISLGQRAKADFLKLLFHFRNFSSFFSSQPIHQNIVDLFFRFLWSAFVAQLRAVERMAQTSDQKSWSFLEYSGHIGIIECSLFLLLIRDKKFFISWKCRSLFQRKYCQLSFFRYSR